MTIGTSERYQSDSLPERIAAVVHVLDDEQNSFRGAREADALFRMAPRDPDAAGLTVRARGMAALARHRRDGGSFPADPAAPHLKDFLTEAATLLASFPSTLQNTNELALGRALFRLVSGNPSSATQLLSATLKERRDIDKQAAVAFAGRLAGAWLDSDLIAAASGENAHQPLFDALTEVVLDTPIEDLDPRLCLVVGKRLFDHSSHIFREVGADLVEHSYDTAEATGRMTERLYDAAVQAVLVRQAVGGRASRLAERAARLSEVAQQVTGRSDEEVWGRDLELVLSQLQMDLIALLWTVANSPEPERGREPHARLRSSLSRVERWRRRIEADLAERASESEAQTDQRVESLVAAVRSVEQVERTARVLGHVATGRMAWASDVLEKEEPQEGLETLSQRLWLLMQTQLAGGRFSHLRKHAETLASLPKREGWAQAVKVENAVFEAALMGLLWLRSFDEAQELVDEAARLRILTPSRSLDLMIRIASGRAEDDLRTTASLLKLRLLVEKALDHLEAEEEEDLALMSRLTAPHIYRRRCLRWVSRGYYHALVGEYDFAENACAMAKELFEEGSNEEWSEAQSRDTVEAVIAFGRGDLGLVEALLSRGELSPANRASRQILRAMAAIDREDLATSRRELSRLYRDRPGDLLVAIAFSAVLQMPDKRPQAQKSEDTGSRVGENGSPDTAATVRAAAVLADLMSAVEQEGHGYSAVTSKRAQQYVLISSASVETQLAIFQWSNYKQAGQRIQRARAYLDTAQAMGGGAPAWLGVQTSLGGLEQQWARRRPGRRNFAWATFFVVIGCALWLTSHPVGDPASTSMLAAVSFVAAALCGLFPWVRKLSFRGVELERVDFTKEPREFLPQLDSELLMDMMRDQFSESLRSTLLSMAENIRHWDAPRGLRLDEERARAGAMPGAQAGASDLRKNALDSRPT